MGPSSSSVASLALPWEASPKTVIAFRLAGQANWQAPDEVPFFTTIQLPWWKWESPFWTRFLSSRDRGSMAPVGQDAVQAVHSYWQ